MLGHLGSATAEQACVDGPPHDLAQGLAACRNRDIVERSRYLGRTGHLRYCEAKGRDHRGIADLAQQPGAEGNQRPLQSGAVRDFRQVDRQLEAFRPLADAGDEHAHPLIDLQPTQPGIVYRLPGLSVFPSTIVTAPLGMARGAMDAFVAIAGKKARAGTTMSDPHRREFLTATAGITTLAMLSATQQAAAGDPSFMNNVPDPALADKELPTFKFALEKSQGKVIGNSFGKEATVTQLPISKGIAGVSMKLEPGAMRELHWHGPVRSRRTSRRSAGQVASTSKFEFGNEIRAATEEQH